MKTDVLIVGAGAAGLFCAIEAGKRGRKVTVLDHSKKLGGKILISGGGRCNFTNTGASPDQYVSQNPHFCRSALSRFTSSDFIKIVQEEGIAFHEKKLGQLFCDTSAKEIIQMLEKKCSEAAVSVRLGEQVTEVSKKAETFFVKTANTSWAAESLVIATGGLSLPKLGATSFGYEVAQQFGLNIVETAPALDGFVFSENEKPFTELAGLSLDCEISCEGKTFRENILFTHSGISGPGALQASLHWWKGSGVSVNLLPELKVDHWLLEQKEKRGASVLKSILSEVLPSRFVEKFLEQYFPNQKNLADLKKTELDAISEKLSHWTWTPTRTVGYNKAEVTRGGVDTDELSSKTMEAKKVLGLYFIGEVVDVTGWLGGYNFQWAWSSGWAAGQVV